MSDIKFYYGQEENLPVEKEADSLYVTKDSGKLFLGDKRIHGLPLDNGEGENSIQQLGSEAIGDYSVAMGAPYNLLDSTNPIVTVAKAQGSRAHGGGVQALSDGASAEGINTVAGQIEMPQDQQATNEAIPMLLNNEYTKKTILGQLLEREDTKEALINKLLETESVKAMIAQSYGISVDQVTSELMLSQSIDVIYNGLDEICKDSYGAEVVTNAILTTLPSDEFTNVIMEHGGFASHAEGILTNALATSSHAEGVNAIAAGYASHVEGLDSQAIGDHSHAEGAGTVARGKNSHAEGWDTVAYGMWSHAEGSATQAVGNSSHVEGSVTIAKGIQAHAEGYGTKAIGHRSHTEGWETTAYEIEGHAEGRFTEAIGQQSHAQGYNTRAVGHYSHAEGKLSDKDEKDRENYGAIGTGSHSEGYDTAAKGSYSHSEGAFTVAEGEHSHAEGYNTKAIGHRAHSEGWETEATDINTHAEGYKSKATNNEAHAEGYETEASGLYSHSEGKLTVASGGSSHAEGYSTQATANDSHSEGNQTIASGYASHAEGGSTEASNQWAHAEGLGTKASGAASHAGGKGTKATGEAQTAIGKYNQENDNALFIVGNGTDGDPSNAFEVTPERVSVNADLEVNWNIYSGPTPTKWEAYELQVYTLTNGYDNFGTENIPILNNLIAGVRTSIACTCENKYFIVPTECRKNNCFFMLELIDKLGGGRHLFGPMRYKSSNTPTIEINTLVTKPTSGDTGKMYITKCQIVGTNFLFYGYEFPNSMTFDAFVNNAGTTDLFTWIGKDGAFSLNCYIL